MLSYIALTSISEEQTTALYGKSLSEEQLTQLKAQRNALLNLTPFDVIAGLLERIMTVIIHVALTLLVFYAVFLNKKLFLGLAVLVHALLDFFAVYAGQTLGIWPTE